MSDPTKRETRKLKLRTRVAKKSGAAPILSWRKQGLADNEKYSSSTFNIILDPEIEVGSAEYLDLERKIQEAGATIIEKHSNLFQDSIVVVIPTGDGVALAIERMEGVDIMVLRAKPKALITIDGVDDVALITTGNACSAAQASNQATIIDVINGAKDTMTGNNGGNVNVIVWDFFPTDMTDLNQDELLDRPGGGIVIIDGNKKKGDIHGGAVASTCCGKNVGLASGANLVLLQLTDDIGADLSVIESIAQTSSKPVVVNMSFALQWEDVNTGALQTAVKNSIRDLDDILEDMKQRNPQLLFVVAGGNESLNPCETTSPVSFGSGEGACTDCYFWPQSRLGEPYTPTDVPFVLIGASRVFEGAPQQRQASYTNWGGCMHTFTHGSTVCAFYSDSGGYIGIDGTSFSAPIFSSLAALRWSQRPNDSAADITSYLLSNSPDTVDLQAQAISDGTVGKFSQVAEAMKTGGAEPTPYDGGTGDLVGKDVIPVDGGNISVYIWAALGALVFLLLAGWAYMQRRK
jgi:subtilisin family serine protease